MKQLVAISLSMMLLSSCGSTDPHAHGDSAQPLSDSAVVSNRTDIHQSCCFQTEKDFLPFFPDSCGDFIGQIDRTVEMKCITDTMQNSSSMRAYVDTKGHAVAVTITDYCASQEILLTDYHLLFEEYKGLERQGEFNEFDVPGSHHGFTHYNPEIELAVLIVVVDGRFVVEVSEMQCGNTKNVLAVYEKLPLKELADYCK